MRDGTKSDLCKACETMHVNNYEPDTFMWLLKKYDVPWLPWEWNSILDKAYQKDPYKITGMSVFGKYLSKMKLKQHNQQRFADSERLQTEYEEKVRLTGTPIEQMQEKLDNMKQAYENGEISEAQWLTYQNQNEMRQPEFVTSPEGTVTTAAPSAYPVNDNPFEKVDLPAIKDQLTQEDKIYLATKWGRLYTAEDWLYLEKKYVDFMDSFDIQGAARVDTLVQICKLSLKLNQALDQMDMDSYSKLVRAYDSLMKSAKFTEAQRKEEKSGEFDAVGQVVYFAELKGGKIERFKTTTPLDIFDEKIQDLKNYNKELILNDPSLAQQVENYLKKRIALEESKEREAEARKNGEDKLELTNEDFLEFNELLESDKEQDEEFFTKEEGEE